LRAAVYGNGKLYFLIAIRQPDIGINTGHESMDYS
jgi:hypothetical protein